MYSDPFSGKEWWRPARERAAKLRQRPTPTRSTVLQLRGKDLRSLPLLKRKATLQKELRRTERIVCCQHVAESEEKLFQT